VVIPISAKPLLVLKTLNSLPPNADSPSPVAIIKKPRLS